MFEQMQEISILEWLLKDHVTWIEAWSDDAENTALHHSNTFLNILK